MSAINPVACARAAAAAIAADETIENACLERYAQSLSVYMDSLGALRGADTDTRSDFFARNGLRAITPYMVIGAMAHEDGPVSEGDECTIGAIICIDASQTETMLPENTAYPVRAADGVFEFGANTDLVAIVAAVKAAVADAEIGGQVEKFSVAWNLGDKYPLQSAEITIIVTSPQSF